MTSARGAYGVVYIDPCWQYDNVRTGGSLKSGAAAKYATLSTDAICAIEVPAARDAICGLWATTPLLPDGLRVMAAYGFTYKTCIIWHKSNRNGLGSWMRVNHEILLIGKKGRAKAPRIQMPSVVTTPSRSHSWKPPIFRVIMERMGAVSVPGAPRLEMFATIASEGWVCAGLSLNNIDHRTPRWWEGLS